MFRKKDTIQEDGVKALQDLVAHLGAIAESLKKLEEVIPKIDTIYEAYKDLNQLK